MCGRFVVLTREEVADAVRAVEERGELTPLARDAATRTQARPSTQITAFGISFVPEDFTGDYMQRFTSSYRHVLNIDRHEPWTDPGIADLVRHIGPEWVTNELSSSSRAERNERLRTQLAALGVHSGS